MTPAETAPVPATLSPLTDILLLGFNGGDELPSGHLYNVAFPESKHTEALSSQDAHTRVRSLPLVNPFSASYHVLGTSVSM